MSEDKSWVLWEAFFPRLEHMAPTYEDAEYPWMKFNFIAIKDEQIHRAISCLEPYKAPGADGISNMVLIQCVELLIPHLGPIYQATLRIGVYPDHWKNSVTVVLRKLSKSDYTIPNVL